MTEQAKLHNYYPNDRQHPLDGTFGFYDGLSPASPLDEFEDLPSKQSKLQSPAYAGYGHSDLMGGVQHHGFVSPMEIHPGSANSLASSASNGSPSVLGFQANSFSSSPFQAAFSAPADFHYMQHNAHMFGNPRSPDMAEEDDYTVQLNLQAVMDKRRRRRESHNAVERRRRENINDRIQELGSMLPEHMVEELQSNSNGNNSKPNKGAILRKSVDHIHLLHDEIKQYQQRVQELERTLNILRSRSVS